MAACNRRKKKEAPNVDEEPSFTATVMTVTQLFLLRGFLLRGFLLRSSLLYGFLLRSSLLLCGFLCHGVVTSLHLYLNDLQQVYNPFITVLYIVIDKKHQALTQNFVFDPP